jgi:hypothetical protein
MNRVPKNQIKQVGIWIRVSTEDRQKATVRCQWIFKQIGWDLGALIESCQSASLG